MKTIKRTYDEIEEKVSLTLKQIDFMKHALGIDRMNTNSKKIKPYRNYYKAAKCDEFEWKYLTFWGLANELKNNYFEVSKYGKRILSKILEIEILDD